MHTATQQTTNRRPGIAAIKQRLRDQNPTWTKNQVQSEAKLEWHRKAELVATVAAATITATLIPPPIGQHWPEQGGTYIGIASDLTGGAPGHLVLLDDKLATRLTWTDANAWAAALGNNARLPTRAEALLIFANAKSQLEGSWHWTNEKYNASYAWYCSFSSGDVHHYLKSYEGSAVAVCRLVLQSFNPLDSGAA